jgi:hypothetical protein
MIWIICSTIAVFTLPLAYVWESYNDRDGDLNKKIDVLWRGCLALFAGILNHVFNGVPYYIGTLLSVAIHFMFFDYTIVYIMAKRKVIAGYVGWYEYLGKKGVVDNIPSWRNAHPTTRLIIRIAVFVPSLTWFIYQWYVIHK